MDAAEARDRETILALMAAVNAHDLEAFLATLTEDVVYDFHHEGFGPACGKAEVTAAWHGMLAAFPDLHEDIRDIQLRAGLGVVHWRMTGTLAGPLPVGNRIALPKPGAGPISMRGVDIFTLRDGLVARKDTYADVGVWFEAFEGSLVPRPD